MSVYVELMSGSLRTLGLLLRIFVALILVRPNPTGPSMAPRLVDYKEDVNLKSSGRKVDGFCVSCLLAEYALVESIKHGNSALATKHLTMTSVEMTLDNLGLRSVKVHDENREMAVAIAKRVNADLSSHGLRLRSARVQVNKPNGKKWGDHDMVADVITGPYGAVPDERTPKALMSGELRCRRLWSDAGLAKFRRESRNECDLELDWWQDVLKKDDKGKWSGRFILLVNFSQDLSRMTTRADVRLTEAGQDYKGFWGWPGSCNFLQLPARVPVSHGPSIRLPARPPVRPPPVRPPPRVTLTWDRVNGKLSYEQEPPAAGLRAVSVARINAMLGELAKKGVKVSTNHVGERVSAGKKRHGWTDRDIFKRPRISAKKGGEEAWVAKEHVLKQMFLDIV